VLYCTCVMCIMAGTFVLFVGLRLWQHRVKKQPFRAHTKDIGDEEEVGAAYKCPIRFALCCFL